MEDRPSPWIRHPEMWFVETQTMAVFRNVVRGDTNHGSFQTFNFQLSTFNLLSTYITTYNLQLSTFNFQLSTCFQLSTFNFQPPTFNFQLSTFNFQFSIRCLSFITGNELNLQAICSNKPKTMILVLLIYGTCLLGENI